MRKLQLATHCILSLWNTLILRRNHRFWLCGCIHIKNKTNTNTHIPGQMHHKIFSYDKSWLMPNNDRKSEISNHFSTLERSLMQLDKIPTLTKCPESHVKWITFETITFQYTLIQWNKRIFFSTSSIFKEFTTNWMHLFYFSVEHFVT